MHAMKHLLSAILAAALLALASCAPTNPRLAPLPDDAAFNGVPSFVSLHDASKAESLRRKLQLLDDRALHARPGNPAYCMPMLAAIRGGDPALQILDPVKEAGSLDQVVAGIADLPCPAAKLVEDTKGRADSQNATPETYALYREADERGASRFVLFGSKLGYQPLTDATLDPTQSPRKLKYHLVYATLAATDEKKECVAEQLKLSGVNSSTGLVEPIFTYLFRYRDKYYPVLMIKNRLASPSGEGLVLTQLTFVDQASPDGATNCDFIWR